MKNVINPNELPLDLIADGIRFQSNVDSLSQCTVLSQDSASHIDITVQRNKSLACLNLYSCAMFIYIYYESSGETPIQITAVHAFSSSLQDRFLPKHFKPIQSLMEHVKVIAVTPCELDDNAFNASLANCISSGISPHCIFTYHTEFPSFAINSNLDFGFTKTPSIEQLYQIIEKETIAPLPNFKHPCNLSIFSSVGSNKSGTVVDKKMRKYEKIQALQQELSRTRASNASRVCLIDQKINDIQQQIIEIEPNSKQLFSPN